MTRTNVTFSTGMVLEAIARGYCYGFDIMEATGLPAGTVYPALRRLEAAGHLSSRWEASSRAAAEGRPSRCYYRVTRAGEALRGQALERFPMIGWSLAGGRAPEPERT
jgi:DNA-binding PadR family transcriptional regulator